MRSNTIVKSVNPSSLHEVMALNTAPVFVSSRINASSLESMSFSSL